MNATEYGCPDRGGLVSAPRDLLVAALFGTDDDDFFCGDPDCTCGDNPPDAGSTS